MSLLRLLSDKQEKPVHIPAQQISLVLLFRSKQQLSGALRSQFTRAVTQIRCGAQSSGMISE